MMPRQVVAGAIAVLAGAGLAAGCGGSEQRNSEGVTGPTRVVREERAGPRLIDVRIRSRALGRTASVRLMTPKGWSSRPGARRWPVLYLLHGCCDTYESWTRSTDVEELPELRDVLVVMPEGGPVGFYSNWLGSGGEDGPAWETFHLSKLRRILERRYGAGTRQAIAGQSMGGLGAMGYTARHPGFFLGAASFSGLLHPLGDASFLLALFSRHTPDPLAIWGDPARQRHVWASHDPTALAASLHGTRMFVSAGDGRPGPLDAEDAEPDPIEQTVLRESRAFAGRLRRLRLPAQMDFYGPGTHDWSYWERELRRALPLLLGALHVGTAREPGPHDMQRPRAIRDRAPVLRAPTGGRVAHAARPTRWTGTTDQSNHAPRIPLGRAPARDKPNPWSGRRVPACEKVEGLGRSGCRARR